MRFRINVEPIGKGRPRATAIGGFARLYTPKKTRTYEEQVEAAALAAFRAERRDIFTGPIRVEVNARFTLPTSKHKKRAPVQAQPHIGKPDLDNIYKAVLDGLNGVAFVDDVQIVELNGDKWTLAQGETGYVDVTIMPYDAAPAD